VTDDITIEVPSADDWDAMVETLSDGFNEVWEPAAAEAERLPFEPERALVARRGGQMVGTAAIWTRQLSVPGAVVPTGHVTLVSVRPSARRRGILTRFMRQEMADMRAAGEPLAALWASEGRIYQRFGYGSACRVLAIAADTREVRLPARPDPGRLREGAPAELRDAMVKLYDQLYAQRPGRSERGPKVWDYRLADSEPFRRGQTTLKAIVHETDAGVDGYALWRVASKWENGVPDGEVRVLEVLAGDPAAYTSLWNFLFTLDLTRSTHLRIGAVDEPLQFLVNEPRRLHTGMKDGLWIRVVDVPQALAARRYAAPVDLVLAVEDGFLPENTGRWRLNGAPEDATCVATTDEPDLRCDVQALGAAYLGGTPLTTLAEAGLVAELRPGALAKASVAFGWHHSPSVLEVF